MPERLGTAALGHHEEWVGIPDVEAARRPLLLHGEMMLTRTKAVADD